MTKPGWMWRRWIIFPNVAFSFYLLAMMINGPDTRVNESIAWGLIVNIMSSILIYTGFATAQDIAAIMATRSGTPYPSAPTTAVATDSLQ